MEAGGENDASTKGFATRGQELRDHRQPKHGSVAACGQNRRGQQLFCEGIVHGHCMGVRDLEDGQMPQSELLGPIRILAMKPERLCLTVHAFMLGCVVTMR